MNNIKESTDWLMRLNLDDMLVDCIDHSFENVEWYEAILKEVLKLKEKPKRIIDVGSNYNQYGYLFANEGIEYIGIDEINHNNTKPIITNMIHFINSDYKEVIEDFKDDVIISCLCIGYAVPIDIVKAKVLIVNDLDENGRATAKVVKGE